jgi:transcription initiation factor TFIIIB Brf1 subunit/transcription initiation factor TFIIB
MNEYFNSLDIYSNPKSDEEINVKCCSIIENIMVSEEKTICRICNETINNICNKPEKCYEGGKNTSRVGMPSSELLPDSTVGSVIQQNFICNTTMRMIARYNMYNGIPYKTRSLLNVFNIISENCVRNNISKKIINEAQGIYKVISPYKISRGDNRLGIISACIFMAAKNCNNPRSSIEISKTMNLEKKVVTKGIKLLNDIIRINKISLERMCLKRVETIDLIDRFVHNLPLNDDDITNIKNICVFISEDSTNELSSSTPPSLSASIINMYCIKNNLKITKNEISEQCSISQVTITKLTNVLTKLLNK